MSTTTTRLVRVNSRFRAGGSSAVFSYRFDNVLVDDVQSIELVSAQIPRLFGNIYDNINRFSVLVTGGQVLGEVVVDPGQYTATELAASISLITEPRFGFSVRYDETLKRFIFDSLNDYTFTGRLLPYIGIPNDFPIEPGETPAPHVPNLSGVSQIYLQSEFIGGSNCVDTPEESPYIPLITVINAAAVPYGFVINYERAAQGNSLIQFENLISLRGIDVSLLDQYGNAITLPPTSFSDFVFRIVVRITP